MSLILRMRHDVEDGVYRVTYQFNDGRWICAHFEVKSGIVIDCAPVLRKRLDYWKTKAERILCVDGYDIGFTGSQLVRPNVQIAALDRLFLHLYRHGYRRLHLGDCIGSDTQAWNIGTQYFYLIGHPPIEPRKRSFLTYAEVRGEKHYHERNRDIVHEGHVLIATPCGHEESHSGTWYTINYARSLGRPVYIVWPSGEMELLSD